jgi:D-cysteine desulfhydrase
VHSDSSTALRFGSYPTPIARLAGADFIGDLWLKDDGQTAQLYGGNKVRKLERLLEVARGLGARRVLTLGAAGSHHVLATCLFAQRVGLRTLAVLTAQPWTEHAEETLRAGLHAGLSAVPARSYADALLQLRRQRQKDDFVIGPGGFGLEGTWAYSLAVDELAAQLEREGAAPLDGIVVAAGSGSTAAGLLAGVLRTKVAERVIAVQVAPNPGLRLAILGQALYALRRRGHAVPWREAFRRLHIDRRFLGGGYGHASAAGDAAAEVARSFGLAVEPTYTAKAFASALDWARRMEQPGEACKLRLHRRRTYLYWHTLSSVPLAALLQGASKTLPNELARLLRRP